MVGCSRHQTKVKKILIIKLGARGDVLRTTPILRGLKKKYPQSFISWLTQSESQDLLKDNSLIDRLFLYSLKTIQGLEIEKFDILICLDKETEAITLASRVQSKEKIGFGLDKKTGNVFPLNKESLYAFNLGLSDELKFRQNRKTYPEIIFEMAGLGYQKDEYILKVSDADRKYAQGLLSKIGIDNNDPIIGLNTGAGSRFANKAWTEEGFVELVKLIHDKARAKVFLLGGPEEEERNKRIASKVGNLACDIGCYHSLGQFMAIVEASNLIVSGDTTAMHIAIALKKPVVAIFGSTCEQEIELYGRGIKLTSNIDCRPCYKTECKKEANCMVLIKPTEVLQAIQRLLPK
ncbi:MAG: glycosyltransferase family 9 protein [Candidatus Omnitrophica bacterium]|nr:glycosyltransferase family 9 protein [Candidatus Omnitrophota bacterium]